MSGIRTLQVASGALALAIAGARSAPSQAGLSLLVEAPPELASQAATVRAIGGSDLGPLLDLVGLASPGAPVRVVLATERSPLATRVASWVGGYAVPALDTVVLFPARVPSYPDRNMQSLLRHEIAHVLISRAARGNPLPRWFDEGSATVAAREWGIEDGARAALAGIGSGPRSLHDLDGAFSGDGAAVSRAYAASAALVRDLLRRYGDTAVARILAGTAKGAAFDDAFQSVTGGSPGELASGYFRREAMWTTWVPFVTSSTVLWMGITLLALFAIRGRRDRDAAQREAWALEEHPVKPDSEAADGEDAGGGDAGGGDDGVADDPRRWN